IKAVFFTRITGHNPSSTKEQSLNPVAQITESTKAARATNDFFVVREGGEFPLFFEAQSFCHGRLAEGKVH
ncbi:MAG TPA: hypothetical protein VGB07_32165, partial [Blastocatellia bacterium]